MAGEELRVIFTESAWTDLEEIVSYWTDRGEPERGIQYARDLPNEAVRQLSNVEVARCGRYLRRTAFPETQELPVFRHSYRILYLLKEADRIVQVLRFWHSHRDEPFQN